jgi:hypothetical protein
MSTVALPRFSSPSRALARPADWPLWCAGASSLTVAFGVHWDIAWHRSIGRDAFWSPPHVAIYAGAVFAAVAALAQILPATFGPGRSRDDGLRVLGFRGPLGAFISSWGGVTMLSSAPFDDWWHRTYGLDVKILSPPHVVLALGILALHAGALTAILGAMNRSEAPERRAQLRSFAVIVGAMLMVTILTLFMEKTLRPSMHLGSFYFVIGACIPLVLVGMGEATRWRWAATATTAVYSAFLLALLWVFPLVPAQPKLGPVFTPVHCLLPPEFPLLLVPGAIALDLWRARRADRPGVATAAVGGLCFAAVFLAVQWPFADFLMSPAARNAFWGAIYFDFATPSWSPYKNYLFFWEGTLPHVVGIVASFGAAALSGIAGRGLGRWFALLQR